MLTSTYTLQKESGLVAQAYMNDVSLTVITSQLLVSLVEDLNARCKILLTALLIHVHLDIIRVLKVLFMFKLWHANSY